MSTITSPPIFGTSYDVGWTGFSRSDDAVGNAIAYGERFERGAFPSVNHAFTVVGNGLIVEAQLKNGVVCTALTTRTLDPLQKVYFRKPLGWTPELGSAIAATALSKVGAKYNDLLIAENALADTLAGHVINELFHDWPHEFLDSVIEELTPGEFICSFHAALALASQPEFKGFPLFQRKLSSIDPMLLLVAGPYESGVTEILIKRDATAPKPTAAADTEPAVAGAEVSASAPPGHDVSNDCEAD